MFECAELRGIRQKLGSFSARFDADLLEGADAAAVVKVAAAPDPDATHKRIHAQRSCRRRTTGEGGGEITYRSTLEEANEIWAVVAGFATTQFDLARVEGRHDPQEAYAADGMLAMARAAA